MNFIIIILIVLGSVIVAYGLFIIFRDKFRKRYEQFLQAVGKENIVLSTKQCNFAGQLSKKYKQVKGNGYLAVTDEEIFFEMFLPKKVWQIPFEKINKLQISKTFLNQYQLRPFLRIDFINEKGELDAIALLLKDPDKWMQLISSEIGIGKNE